MIQHTWKTAKRRTERGKGESVINTGLAEGNLACGAAYNFVNDWEPQCGATTLGSHLVVQSRSLARPRKTSGVPLSHFDRAHCEPVPTGGV